MRTLYLVVGLVAALGAGASSAATNSGRVTFSGCPQPGIEGKCMMVKSGGKTYDVTAATPAIEMKGLGISGSGKISDKPGVCQQGLLLEDIKYGYTKMRCPLAHSAK